MPISPLSAQASPPMPKLKCLVVDDDPLAVQVLSQCIARIPTLQLAGTCANATDAVAFLQGQPVDILLLDVFMPLVSGIELLTILRNSLRPPHVILVSSSTAHAVEAFTYNVADYLLKPVSFERLQRAIDRIVANTSLPASAEFPECLFIRVHNKSVRLNYADVHYLESNGNYVNIITQSQRYTLHMPLRELKKRFPANTFWVPHRSFLVNIRHIVRINEHEIVMGEGSLLPISALLRTQFIQRIQAL